MSEGSVGRSVGGLGPLATTKARVSNSAAISHKRGE